MLLVKTDGKIYGYFLSPRGHLRHEGFARPLRELFEGVG